jgi:hypothetical protein
MSGLHRDNRATHNFSGMWKVREDSKNKQETKRAQKWGAHPPSLGARPTYRANQALSRGSCLHRL